jgi:Bacterial Ig domain
VAPSLTFSQPTNGASIIAGAPQTINATTSPHDTGVTITGITVKDNGTLWASVSGASLSTNWSSVTLGSHSLVATATDSIGAATSATNLITVVTNPVSVTFTNVPGSTAFTDVGQDGTPLIAIATGAFPISTVKFYDNGTLLGSGSTSIIPTSGWYTLNWPSASVGAHTITVVAQDSQGETNSATLLVTVNSGYRVASGLPLGAASSYWSTWSCPVGQTPSSKVAINYYFYASWNSALYAKDTSYLPNVIPTANSFNINPDAGGDNVVAFTAPMAGTILIGGTASLLSKGNASDGVNIKIWKNTTQIYPLSGWKFVAAGGSDTPNQTIAVSAGNVIYVQVNCNVNEWWDWFWYPITVTYQ